MPPERFGAYLREFDAVLARHGRRGVYYGHFGDGCLHVRIDFDLASRAGIANFRAFLEDAADLAVAHGGSLSGEHGDGAARAELLPRMYPPEIIRAFEEFKGIWDPDGRLNPDRVVRPAKLDDDLRVFVGVPRIADRPELAFAHDRGSFTRATRRCLGVGKCVTAHGGVMCPSWRATGEEMHSTRGRARLLFEMANGQVIADGWRSDAVARGAGPVPVVQGLQARLPGRGGHGRLQDRVPRPALPGPAPPRRALLDGRPAAVAAPGGAAAGAGGGRAERRGPRPAGRRREEAGRHRPGAGDPPDRPAPVHPGRGPRAARRAPAGIAAGCHRWLEWSRATLLATPAPRACAAPPPVRHGRPRLLLWPDTFTNHFDPAVAADAVAVLEALGYAVELPPRTVCCGLTWTTTGQVDAARRVLRRSLRTIEPWLAAGVPVVGLEPSCTAALRSDGPELFPDEPLAARLATSVRTFAEVLAAHADDLRAAVVASGQRALVQVHCHQHAELGTDADRAAMAALGIEAEILDSGCCGLAGNFGFETGHYAVSMACAERVLLPAVRAAADDVAVLADGFSCRTQLRQAGTREPVHLAQLAARALGLARPHS